MSRVIDFIGDFKTLCQLIFPRKAGETEQARLESFYGGQADSYDNFRERLLHGRDRLLSELIPQNFSGVWIDFGGGTGRNFEQAITKLAPEAKLYLVDLCPSLIRVAQKRFDRLGHQGMRVVEGDAESWRLPEGQADIITFSYSLTMIRNWRRAIDNAATLLSPKGKLGVVDFSGHGSGKIEQLFWRNWFAHTGVLLDSEHAKYLDVRLECKLLEFDAAKLPWLPFLRAPYYQFIGQSKYS